MGKLTVFNFLTLNGCYKGPAGDISWHQHGSDQNEYSIEMLNMGHTLLFGRTTYEMMHYYWTSPDALQYNPEVANGMANADKIVFSKTLQNVSWSKARLATADIGEEVTKLKAAGKNITVLGSGTLVIQLTRLGLVDSYQLMIDPIAISGGTPIFDGIEETVALSLTGTRAFKGGSVLHYYVPHNQAADS